MSRIDWPSLIVGLIVLFYWGRVIKLVYKTKKLTGRAANFVPPEKLGRVLRRVLVSERRGVGRRADRRWPAASPAAGLRLIWADEFARWPAVVGAFVVLYLTMICWRKMGRDWRMGIDPAEKNTLIVSGPYALVRHPIYALQCTLALLTFLASPSVALAVVAVLQCLLLQWEARREERHMLNVHGDIYGDYMRQVGRFLPRGRYRAAA